MTSEMTFIGRLFIHSNMFTLFFSLPSAGENKMNKGVVLPTRTFQSGSNRQTSTQIR